uniref:Uncharacterized protein n=1 Tax=Cyclopterus lumpus TaxID=8103 RepID=A0A8C3AKC9_CYCLU
RRRRRKKRRRKRRKRRGGRGEEETVWIFMCPYCRSLTFVPSCWLILITFQSPFLSTFGQHPWKPFFLS